MKGLSFYVCAGKYGGFRFEYVKGFACRMVLGWIAISLLNFDLDMATGMLQKRCTKLESELTKIKELKS